MGRSTRKHRLTGQVLALLVAALLFAPSLAMADSNRHQSHSRQWQGEQQWHGERYGERRRHGERHWQHDDRRHHGRIARRPVISSFQVNLWAPPPQVSYGCHPVTGVGPYLGRQAQFGATLCYDAYGQAFILPGSQYVIGYLY